MLFPASEDSLGQGFATWVSLHAMNKFYPEWHVWDEFIANDMARGFGLDGLRSSHPIELQIKPGEEGEALDDISYQKGSAVLRMISAFMGEDVFLAGVASYINKFAYSSTYTKDLWESLTEHADTDINKLMNPWVVQTGYPVVIVEEEPSSNGKGIKIKLTQHRYLKTNDATSAEDSIWPLALNVFTSQKVDVPLFTTRETEFTLDSDSYKINRSHTGFYRTLYPPQRFEALKQLAISGNLEISDRAGLISDLGALVIAGYVKTSVLLDWVEGLKQDESTVVWTTMLAQLDAARKAWRFGDESVSFAESVTVQYADSTRFERNFNHTKKIWLSTCSSRKAAGLSMMEIHLWT